MQSAAEYPPLYLSGIERFNRQAYFESHEVWEDLWRVAEGTTKQFYKGLIQAAVALHHLRRGNLHGARKLLAGAQKYLSPFRPSYMGLDVQWFLAHVACCFEGLPPTAHRIARNLVPIDQFPKIRLTPPAE
jgi:predicted metal-dependent hydrolase